MALPTFLEFYNTVKASFALAGFKVTSFTLFGGGASAYIYYNTGVGKDTYAEVAQGVNYIGVPGPELAAGLPILVAAIAYGSYRAMRKSRTMSSGA